VAGRSRIGRGEGQGGRAFPDDVDADHVSVALIGDDPYVRGPARGPQQGAGGPEILGRGPGRAPQPHPLAKRLGCGAHHKGRPAVPGLDPGSCEPGPEAVRGYDPPCGGDDRLGPGWCDDSGQRGQADHGPLAAEGVQQRADHRGQASRQRELVPPPPSGSEHQEPGPRPEQVVQVGEELRLGAPPRAGSDHGPGLSGYGGRVCRPVARQAGHGHPLTAPLPLQLGQLISMPNRGSRYRRLSPCLPGLICQPCAAAR
jgi:hypothetical protein